MDLSRYQQLSGQKVPSNKTGYMSGILDRVKSQLEVMLGYTLSPEDANKNFYNELGKTSVECSFLNVDTEVLQDPDEVVGGYRLFPYNELDQFFHIDPFKTINKVKLVFLKQGASPNGITIRTFNDNHIKVQMGPMGVGRFLEPLPNYLYPCRFGNNYVQLAVDADWLWDDFNDIPTDLQHTWSDMVDYYSLGEKRFIMSESITSHSYRKYMRSPQEAPEKEPNNLAILKQYVGPWGSLSVMPTTGAHSKTSGGMGRFGSQGFSGGDVRI